MNEMPSEIIAFANGRWVADGTSVAPSDEPRRRYKHVPPGYRVVKEEPTDEMLDGIDTNAEQARASWNYMLAASSKPKEVK